MEHSAFEKLKKDQDLSLETCLFFLSLCFVIQKMNYSQVLYDYGDIHSGFWLLFLNWDATHLLVSIACYSFKPILYDHGANSHELFNLIYSGSQWTVSLSLSLLLFHMKMWTIKISPKINRKEYRYWLRKCKNILRTDSILKISSRSNGLNIFFCPQAQHLISVAWCLRPSISRDREDSWPFLTPYYSLESNLHPKSTIVETLFWQSETTQIIIEYFTEIFGEDSWHYLERKRFFSS